MESKSFNDIVYVRTSDPVEFVAWAISEGWTDFEQQTGNSIATLCRRKRWVRSYTDERNRHCFGFRPANRVGVLES